MQKSGSSHFFSIALLASDFLNITSDITAMLQSDCSKDEKHLFKTETKFFRK